MKLQGKVALITGGAVRVGRAITLELAAAGAHVIINYNRSADAAQQTADDARALGVNALPIQADVADFAAVDRMAELLLARFGGVDVIVNSASYFGKTPFPSADPAVRTTWQQRHAYAGGWPLRRLQRTCADHAGARQGKAGEWGHRQHR